VGLRGRVQAVLVDWTAVLGERGGVGDLRRRLLSGARGRVIEIGAGTGANLRHYPRDLERLVLVEPVEEMARRIEERLAATGRTASVVRARAEDLPVEDASFDTAVTTLVLCSVREPARALAEIRRVLVPGGQLLFLEHVRSCAVRLAGW
jgi:ubiquinone/menaquinone biosynthesis C-methylase UbiE